MTKLEKQLKEENKQLSDRLDAADSVINEHWGDLVLALDLLEKLIPYSDSKDVAPIDDVVRAETLVIKYQRNGKR
jgi:hypothetical protein